MVVVGGRWRRGGRRGGLDGRGVGMGGEGLGIAREFVGWAGYGVFVGESWFGDLRALFFFYPRLWVASVHTSYEDDDAYIPC